MTDHATTTNAPPKPPVAPAPPKELTPPERLQALLTHLTDQAKHNAPITQWVLNELATVVNGLTGVKVVTPLHDFAEMIFVKKPDNTVVILESVEEALEYVRALPKDVQARPHWVAADKALVEAITTNAVDPSNAAMAFNAAWAAERKLAPPVVVKPAPVQPHHPVQPVNPHP
jgi:hypothetical protein